MRPLTLFTLLPAAALAAILSVDVGKNGFAFSPDTLTAATEDTVVFHFYPGAHSVAQSTFDSPCEPSSGGIWSGVFNTANGEDSNVFQVPIANTDPIWIYCAQVRHCNGGMAMVINPPSGGDTLTAYKSAAQNAQLVIPSVVEGGTVTPATAVSTEAESASETTSETTSEITSSTTSSSPASSVTPTSSGPTSSAPTASAAASTSVVSSSAAPSSPPTHSSLLTTSASSISASGSASAAGTTTASSSVATFTSSSNRNTVNAFMAVACAGALGLAILY